MVLQCRTSGARYLIEFYQVLPIFHLFIVMFPELMPPILAFAVIFRTHRNAQPVATHVAWSVCLFVTTVSPTKTDERIQMPLECKLTGAGGKGTMYGGYTLAPLGEYECFSCHLL